MDLKTKLIIGIALTGASVAGYFIWKAKRDKELNTVSPDLAIQEKEIRTPINSENVMTFSELQALEPEARSANGFN